MWVSSLSINMKMKWYNQLKKQAMRRKLLLKEMEILAHLQLQLRSVVILVSCQK
jgi:hypothetical protein